MAQPKKSGSSARKPAARKPAAGKPAARKPAAAKTARKPAAAKTARKPTAAKTARKRPAAKASGGARRATAATSQKAGPAREEKGRDDQLHAAMAAVRDMLSKGIVLTGDLVQETVDEAVKRGRMTREDAEELVQNLVAIGRRQSQDALTELESLVGRSAKETRRLTRERVKSVGSAARRAPGSDRALRTVDRVRRAAGLGPAFPVTGYDDLTAAQVKQRLDELNPAELRKVRDHERRNANRKSVLTAIERKLQ